MIAQRPLPLVAELDIEDDEHRVFDCPGYQACLEYAAQEDWTSWSCAMCPVRGRGAVRMMRPDGLDVSGEDWAPSPRIVYDPIGKKVVAGRVLACQGKIRGVDALQVSVVAPAECPLCIATLWGEPVLQGRDGCSAGHRCVTDKDGYIAVI